MDFFAHQDRARRNSFWLIALCTLGFVCTIGLLFALCTGLLLAMSGYSAQFGFMEVVSTPGLWPHALEESGMSVTKVALISIGGGLLVIGGSALFKIAELSSGGGASVAQSLGGELIPIDTQDFHEKRLLNIVEEMALASGVPTPPVYLLDEEASINAFAAGTKPEAAVIGVTKGCMTKLTRDQLQAVVGHEFSHILNGDMRINLRFSGLIFGFFALVVLGRMMLRTVRVRTSSRNKGGNPLPFIGIGLIIIGAIAAFFGRAVQAALSRQREFLADASAVQFTRNRDGMIGALEAIRQDSAGRLKTPQASNHAHMFFSSAVSGFFSLATHPPLATRITRLGGALQEKASPHETLSSAEQSAASPAYSGLSGATLGSIGNPHQEHIDYAHDAIAALPLSLRNAHTNPASAQSVVFALLMDTDETISARQNKIAEAAYGSAMADAITAHLADVRAVPAELHLSLLDLMIGALHGLTIREKRRLIDTATAFIDADGQMSVQEYALAHALRKRLPTEFNPWDGPSKPSKAPSAMSPDLALAITLSHLSQHAPDPAQALSAGLGLTLSQPAPLPLAPEDRSQAALGEALECLDAASPNHKRTAVEAWARTALHQDGVSPTEIDILRSFCASISVPMPPILTEDGRGGA